MDESNDTIPMNLKNKNDLFRYEKKLKSFVFNIIINIPFVKYH